MTLPYAEVIGDPVSHSKSPAIHRFWLEQLGLRGDYRAMGVRMEDLSAYFESRRADPAWRGCNLTMPLKQAVLPLLSALDKEAETTGAVNMVTVELRGFNTDVAGVRECLAAHAGTLHDPIRIIGTGGAARAAVRGILACGYGGPIFVHGRSEAKARALAGDLLGDADHGRVLDPADLSGAGLIINASPLGMSGFPDFPLEAVVFRKGMAVFDMVYNPLNTALLEAARRHDVITIDGLDMLIAQARAAFRGFFGTEPPSDTDGELRRVLTR